MVFLLACGEGKPDARIDTNSSKGLLPPDRPCGNSLLADVQDLEGNSVGVLELLNDEEQLWLSFSPTLSYRLERANLFIGAEEDLPRDQMGNDLPSEFPIRLHNRKGEVLWHHHVDLDSLPPQRCFVIAASIQVTDREDENERGNQSYFSWALGGRNGFGPNSINYCIQTCEDEPVGCEGEMIPGAFRTHSPEGWKTELQEGKVGVFLEEKFPAALPQGLELGCDRKIVLTSSEAVKAFLPGSGPGAVLAANHEDPEGLENGLASELCALGLALVLDTLDADFGASPAGLSMLQVTEGPFARWKVRDLYVEANAVLGGCASNYSAGQMEEVIRNINLNFANGEVSEGFLQCESE